MKARFYSVICNVCDGEIGLSEPCFDHYGDIVCRYCAAEFDLDELEEIRGEDALYNAQSICMNLDDARER